MCLFASQRREASDYLARGRCSRGSSADAEAVQQGATRRPTSEDSFVSITTQKGVSGKGRSVISCAIDTLPGAGAGGRGRARPSVLPTDDLPAGRVASSRPIQNKNTSGGGAALQPDLAGAPAQFPISCSPAVFSANRTLRDARGAARPTARARQTRAAPPAGALSRPT
ncbi:hypothetical protein EVAR_4963_1 [Eumeta japonica]|uniref:Uncharacterized protein n=1 Tax=Eumeta variegata TaxID=151549 RepID=A0A4C1V0D9_EUMVA|nr:hypothetical protein EVAR_4963_1 [Eumeta japonica]